MCVAKNVCDEHFFDLFFLMPIGTHKKFGSEYGFLRSDMKCTEQFCIHPLLIISVQYVEDFNS